MSAPNAAPNAATTTNAVTVAPTTRRELSPEQAALIMKRRAINEVARQLGNLSWGKGMTPAALQATAEYCRRYNIDPATELDVLGGKLYRNANYYIRRGAELMRQGVVDDVQVVHCNVDERLAALAKRQVEGAQEEMDRRELLRIKHNIPDAATGAVVVRVRLASTGVWLEGANDAGYGQDPVGKQDPGKTAETRAYRRVWKLLVDTVPKLRDEESEVEQATAVVSTVVEQEAERAERIEATMPGQKSLVGGSYDDLPLSNQRDTREVRERERDREVFAEPEEESDEDIRRFEQDLAQREGQ